MVFNPEELLQSNLTKDGAQVINSHWGNNETRFRQINTNLGSHQTKFWNLGAWSSSQWEVGWPSSALRCQPPSQNSCWLWSPHPSPSSASSSSACHPPHGPPLGPSEDPSRRPRASPARLCQRTARGVSPPAWPWRVWWGRMRAWIPTLDYICNKSGICLVMLNALVWLILVVPTSPASSNSRMMADK